MPAVARSAGEDQVFSPHGDKRYCLVPTTQYTNQGVTKVYVEGTLAIKVGNTMTTHNAPYCTPHTPTLDAGSSKVYVEGAALARIGDVYWAEHPIISGSSKVFAG
jgi:uncharacterized Zn-binding protein involved in type VI secretion